MSNCKYTEVVTPNTCLGDSLATFNDNFFKLDNAVCSQPIPLAGNGIRLNRYLTEQNINAVKITAAPTVIYGTTFEWLDNGATSSQIGIADGTRMPAASFPTPQTSAVNPLATFSAASLTNASPKVTIYWTASGNDYGMVYSTNESTSVETDLGTLGFNGPVTTILSAGDFLYVGGAFTNVGGYEFRKMCVIDINKGTDSSYINGIFYSEVNLGFAGQVVEAPVYDVQLARYVPHPLLDNGGFGTEGEITSILQSGDLLIIGGTYKNVSGKNLGRGLTIWNSKTKRIYPFYVNGDVNVLHVESNELYIGGSFDFINYGPNSASEISGQRVYANGLAKVSLSLIESFANKSIIQLFCENVRLAFDKYAVIYSITSSPTTGTIYIGGDFRCHDKGMFVSSSLAIVSPEGTFNSSWQPIIEGVVHKLLIDENTLYVAGLIPYYITASGLEQTPKPFDRYYNLICFDVESSYYPTLVPTWKPKVNGPVHDIAIHNGTDGTRFLYCYGNFDEVNGVSVNFLGAVPRNAGTVNNINEGQTSVNWKMNLNKPPGARTKALLRLEDSIVVGGAFDQINSHKRKYLCRLNGPYEEQVIERTPQVVWSLGAQIVNPGGSFSSTLTNNASVTATCVRFGDVNKTTFPLEYTNSVFDGYKEGSLMRFMLRRMYNTNVKVLSSEAYVTGWKIEFDNN